MSLAVDVNYTVNPTVAETARFTGRCFFLDLS